MKKLSFKSKFEKKERKKRKEKRRRERNSKVFEIFLVLTKKLEQQFFPRILSKNENMSCLSRVNSNSWMKRMNDERTRDVDNGMFLR